MSREIKFRAWNGAIFRYYPVGMSICRMDRFEISQFTGMKDKTGTDIYEGDILLLEKFDISFNDEEVDAIREVFFTEGGFHIKETEMKDYAYCAICMAGMDMTRVIGNIYQDQKPPKDT